MSTKHKVQPRPWSVDELGVVTWAEDTDPIREVRGALKVVQAAENLQIATDNVHLVLSVARSIAVSLFGNEWPEYVMDVYDRLKDMKDDFDHADDPPVVE